MIYILNNFLPISSAALSAFILAVLYDSYFNRQRSLRVDVDPDFNSTEAFAFRLGLFVSLFWMASILAGAIILAPTDEGAGPWSMALGSAIIIWAGFILPAFYVTYRFNKMSARLTGCDSLFWLVILLVMASIIRVIGVTSPG